MTATLTARAPRLQLEAVGRDWLGGHHVATQISNAMHLLFPAGERFFVRSVLHFRARLSPELAAEVRQFCKQEGSHAKAHERFFDNLRGRGYDIDTILARYQRLAFGFFEKRLPPSLRLSITAALEHFTAMFAADALSTAALDSSEPEMRDLLMWHAVEELEHKAVAFEVLRAVAPGYFLRVAGLVLACAGLGGFWLSAARALLAADGISLPAAIRALRADGSPPIADAGGIARGVLAYLRPRFHPNDVDHAPLVEAALASLRSRDVLA